MVNEKYPRPSNRFILQALDIASAFLAALPLIPSNLPAGKCRRQGKQIVNSSGVRGSLISPARHLVPDFLVSSESDSGSPLIARRCPMFPMKNIFQWKI